MAIRPKDKRDRQRAYSIIEMLIAMAIIVIASAIAVPKVVTMAQNFRTGGDAHNLNSMILLAKMRASADFGQARVHMDMGSQTFYVEVESSGATLWTTEGGTQSLSNNVSFGYGSVPSAPANTQSTLAQAPACITSGSAVANSACITFNSRGIPVDSTNTPTGNDAVYVTDGKSVTGVTVSVTGLTKVWRTDASAANWIIR
jgi:prepilin-type N-terminal cleavage/methylation domain-containing protein